MLSKAIIALISAIAISLGICGGDNAFVMAAEPSAFFVRAYVSECASADTLAAEAVPADTIVRKPLFAISSNFLFEYATIFTGYNTVPFTVGIEVPIANNWSATADYIITTPWHAWNNNAECVEIMHLALGGRWYPFAARTNTVNPKYQPVPRKLDGLFAYASVGVGYYDFELSGKGYQGEDILGAVGAGYSFILSDALSLNFALGFGPLYTRYRYYEGRSNNEHLMFQYRGTWRYFGPTDAKVSLVWLLYNNRKRKSQE